MSYSRGDASQKLMEHLARDCPEAWLVVSCASARHFLREECMIGPTNDSDIRMEGHAEVFAMKRPQVGALGAEGEAPSAEHTR